MIYVTGDTHGSFERVENFCQRFNTKNDDIMIILGDAGINFSGPRYDRLKKRQLEELPITIFAIHGNHEQRPFTIESYKEQVWNGGMVEWFIMRKNFRAYCLLRTEKFITLMD